MKNNVLIKSLGFETLGVSVPIDILQSNREKTFNAFIKIASGFGGCNAAAIFKKIN
jgi:3-oxoacyl-[acyl-carrier-protein] synthase-1